MILIVKTPDRLLCLGLGFHLNKSEALAPPGVTVGNDLSALHGPKLGKELLEL
jgi:hypothetical protein